MKAYITKNLFKRGITTIPEIDGQILKIENESLIVYKKNPFPEVDPDLIPVAFYKKPDWHLTKKEAIERAEQMRIQEINKLLKRIKKLENLKFE